MSILKKNINLHPFTAPSADTILIGAGIDNTITAANSDTGGKEGGETLKLPSPCIFSLFARLMDVWEDIAGGVPLARVSFPNSDYNPFDEQAELCFQYSQFRDLIDVLDGIGDEYKRDTILTAIQHQAYDIAESIADEYPVLQPFFYLGKRG